MFYTIYDVLLFKFKKQGISEKSVEDILRKNGIKSKQIEILKNNCIQLIPEDTLNTVLELSGLSNLEMNLMLGNVPLEYEESYSENIPAIAQLLLGKKF